ncbi:MAG: FixH family protein [Chloroflexales bacterium]|nr:FixH family protein [Chloroflexales bacterium]
MLADKPIVIVSNKRIGTAARYYLCVGFLALLTACGSPTDTVIPPPSTTRQEQTVDNLTISLETSTQPRVNQSQQFRIVLTDDQGNPIDRADVYLNLDMPAMPMGTNRPEAQPEGEGVYLVDAVYTMSGEWTITVVATVEEQEYRTIFTKQVQE